MLYRPVLTFEPVDEILMCGFKGGLTQNNFFYISTESRVYFIFFFIFGTLFSEKHTTPCLVIMLITTTLKSTLIVHSLPDTSSSKR